MNYVSLILALLVFALMAFGVKFDKVNIEAVGLCFFVAGFILPGGLPWAPRPPNA